MGNTSYNTMIALLDANCDMRSDNRERVKQVLSDYVASDYSAKHPQTAALAKQFIGRVCTKFN